MKQFHWLLAILVCLSLSGPVWPQSEKEVAGNSTEIAKLENQLDKKIAELRGELKKLQTIRVKHFHSTTYDEAFQFFQQYEDKAKQGNAVRDQLVPIALELFNLKNKDDGKVDDQLAYLVTNIMKSTYDQGQYILAYELAEKLIRSHPDNGFAEVFMAKSGVLTNHFGPQIQKAIESNMELFKEEQKATTETEKHLMSSIPYLSEQFQKEQKIRDAESAADDLPRVKFETSQGSFEFELFENEAPETVANFISLVEAGHYDGLLFHTVIDQTAAETGILAEDGSIRDPGYTIHDEFNREDARMNFAGSVSLNSEKPDTGASRFFISLAPMPNFNNNQTVFGRVRTGMETVYRLNKTFKIEEQEQIEIEDVVPDKVISAKVMRKRSKHYKPNKVNPEKR